MRTIFGFMTAVSIAFLGCMTASSHSELYHQRASLFKVLPVTSNDIVFVGNSITHGCEWHELFDNPAVKNRGINGDVIAGIRERIDPVVEGHPRKIFLMGGVNDISHNLSADSIGLAMGELIDYIRMKSPETRLYVQACLPINNFFGRYKLLKGKEDVVRAYNRILKSMAAEKGYTFIDTYSLFADADGNLDHSCTNDGLHLMGNAYMRWRDFLLPYINE